MRADLGKIHVELLSDNQIKVDIDGVKISPINVHPNYSNLLTSIDKKSQVTVQINIMSAKKRMEISLDDFEFTVLLRFVDEIGRFGDVSFFR
jgi:hypothetical protein